MYAASHRHPPHLAHSVAEARSGRRGAVVIIIALLLTVLLGFAALVVDLGYAGSVEAELQAATDAAAHSGAMQLDGTEAGVDEAYEVAEQLGAANHAGGESVELDGGSGSGSEIATGYWDADSRSFTEVADPATTNAVQVEARRAALPAWFSAVAFGRDALEAASSAVAIQRTEGAGAVSCYLPLAVPECLITDRYGADVNDHDLVLNPAGIDNVGWGRVAGSPNASWLRDMFEDCEADGTVSVGDQVGLDNGVKTSVLQAIADEVEDASTYWDSDLWGPLPAQRSRSGIDSSAYGNTLEGPVLLFSDPDYCAYGGSFTGDETVSGFAWAAIYDVVTTGPVADRNIVARLEVLDEYDLGDEGGGPDYGVTATTVALVN